MSDVPVPAIQVEGARKAYKRIVGSPSREAVGDVSISVAPHTIHGLLGPNGAGKTTTIKMLLGLVRPTAGSFRILGEDSTRPVGRKRVGFMPEQPYFPQHLSAGHALKLYAQLAGVPKGEIGRRTSDLLGRVGLSGRERGTLSTFSRGMLQRLGIAQALIASPEVVILDEPASGLDPVGQRDIRNLMLELRDSGVTILLSSHQLSEVETVCDEVTILNGGRVAAKGDLDDLLNVEGFTSIRVRGLGESLPPSIASLARNVAVSGSTSVFSIADASVRTIVDLVDEAGGQIVALAPVRDSLEDYFARLLAQPLEEVPQ